MSDKYLELLAQTIFDKKGQNILALDIREISDFADYLLIAEGNVDRHLQAIAVALVDEMKKHNITASRIEGKLGGDWIVIDFGNIVVHLFLPQIREKYRLEQLWKRGKIVDLSLKDVSTIMSTTPP